MFFNRLYIPSPRCSSTLSGSLDSFDVITVGQPPCLLTTPSCCRERIRAPGARAGTVDTRFYRLRKHPLREGDAFKNFCLAAPDGPSCRRRLLTVDTVDGDGSRYPVIIPPFSLTFVPLFLSEFERGRYSWAFCCFAWASMFFFSFSHSHILSVRSRERNCRNVSQTEIRFIRYDNFSARFHSMLKWIARKNLQT